MGCPAVHSTLLHDAFLGALQIEKAASVVVVGGGPVGIEVAAEIVHHYPAKKVRVCGWAPRVCCTQVPPCLIELLIGPPRPCEKHGRHACRVAPAAIAQLWLYLGGLRGNWLETYHLQHTPC